MKVQYYTATTLDGFIASEEDSLEWLFALGNVGETGYEEFFSQVGAVVMGSTTYEWILRNDEAVAAETGAAWPYNKPTWVFSSRKLELVPGADLRLASGTVADHFSRMKEAAAGKNIWIVGGGDLAGQFHDAGLLDQLLVYVGSATLGRGRPLFPRELGGDRLKLESVRKISAGMAELVYNVVN